MALRRVRGGEWHDVEPVSATATRILVGWSAVVKQRSRAGVGHVGVVGDHAVTARPDANEPYYMYRVSVPTTSLHLDHSWSHSLATTTDTNGLTESGVTWASQ